MSQLLIEQQLFFRMTIKLHQWLIDNGYEATYGEVLRSKLQAQDNAEHKTGISNSLHCLKLAEDLAIFKDGKMLSTFEEYEPIGIFWETIGGSWGGRFKNQDCDHFSRMYQGVR